MVTTELRRDPITGRWTVVETVPANSLHELEKGTVPFSHCPFCEGHESDAGRELLAWREGTPPNAPGWSVRVVANPSPVLRVEARADDPREGLLEWREGLGAHEVVVETPVHGETMSAMSAEQVYRVAWAWRERLRDLKRDTRLKAAVVFKNHGPLAGALVPHAHSQIVATPMPPPALEDELEAARAHLAATGGCIYCDLMAQEAQAGARVVHDGDVAVVAAFAPRVPFELWLLPKGHAARFENAGDAELRAMAEAMGRALRGLDWALQEPSYNLVLHTAPFDATAEDERAFHWHVEIAPRVTRVGGLEWGTGLARVPVSPEEAAAILRPRWRL